MANLAESLLFTTKLLTFIKSVMIFFVEQRQKTLWHNINLFM